MYSPEKLSDFVKVIPRDLLRPNELKSWLAFGRCVLIFVLLQVSIFYLPLSNSLWSILLSPILILLAGLSIVGLFVIGHDCGHYAFSRHRCLNDLVGFLCFIPMLSSFFAWRVAHDFHHRHCQVRKLDPDWAELLVTTEEMKRLTWHQKLSIRLGLGGPLGILLGFWVGMIKRSFFSMLIPQLRLSSSRTRKLYIQNALSFALSLVLLWIYAKFLGVEKFVMMFAFPAVVATCTGAFLTFLHHSHPGSYAFDPEGYDHVRSQVYSTFNIRFPRFFEYLWLDINIHVPHHILPVIPWYNLKTANVSLKHFFATRVQEAPFSWKLLRRSWKSYPLNQVSPGAYRLS